MLIVSSEWLTVFLQVSTESQKQLNIELPNLTQCPASMLNTVMSDSIIVLNCKMARRNQIELNKVLSSLMLAAGSMIVWMPMPGCQVRACAFMANAIVTSPCHRYVTHGIHNVSQLIYHSALVSTCCTQPRACSPRCVSHVETSTLWYNQ